MQKIYRKWFKKLSRLYFDLSTILGRLILISRSIDYCIRI